MDLMEGLMIIAILDGPAVALFYYIWKGIRR